MITLDGVALLLGGRRVLDGISCSLPERRIAVLGPNGSGKSSFGRLLNGLAQPSEGRVLVDGLDPAQDLDAVRRKVGYVFQNPDNQIVFPIVEEDVAFGLRNQGLGRAEAEAQARAALASYGLASLATMPADRISGGEKQLVALIGVMVMRPDIIVFDEPTTLLDLRNRNRIAAEIAGLDQRAIVVTHDLDLVLDYDRALVLDQGRIVADDTPRRAVAWYREHLA